MEGVRRVYGSKEGSVERKGPTVGGLEGSPCWFTWRDWAVERSKSDNEGRTSSSSVFRGSAFKGFGAIGVPGGGFLVPEAEGGFSSSGGKGMGTGVDPPFGSIPFMRGREMGRGDEVVSLTAMYQLRESMEDTST